MQVDSREMKTETIELAYRASQLTQVLQLTSVLHTLYTLNMYQCIVQCAVLSYSNIIQPTVVQSALHRDIPP